MKKQRIRLSAKRTAILIAIICTAGILALTASILFAPAPSSVTAEKKLPPLPPVPVPPKPTAPVLLPPVSDTDIGGKKENSDTKDRQIPTVKPSKKVDTKSGQKTPVKPAETKGTQNAAKSEPPEKTEPPIKPDLPVKPAPSGEKKEIPTVSTGTLIVVFDDAGYNTQQLNKIVALPFPVTVAVLPGLDYSIQAADMVRKGGKELFLHQPMQAKNLSVNPGPGAILPDMTAEEAAAVVLANLAEVGPVSGLNNHEGSLITESAELIGAVLDVCYTEKILFLDSRTTAQTAAPQAALERGMKITGRDIFLDNSQDRAEIEKMLEAGVKIAEKKGFAILIGHVWSTELADILLDAWPALTERGIVFATPTQIRR